MFAGKHGFITLRDLFRWADRYRLEQQTEASQDWLQHLANDGETLSSLEAATPFRTEQRVEAGISSLSGYMLLAGRVRKPEEEAVILSILAKNFKRSVNPEELFSQKQLTSQFSECCCRGSPFAFATTYLKCFFSSVFFAQEVAHELLTFV